MEIIDERRKMNEGVNVLWLLEDNIYIFRILMTNIYIYIYNIDGRTNDYNYI